MIERFQKQELQPAAPRDFSKIKVGTRSLDDAVLLLGGDKRKANNRLANKDYVLKAIE